VATEKFHALNSEVGNALLLFVPDTVLRIGYEWIHMFIIQLPSESNCGVYKIQGTFVSMTIFAPIIFRSQG